MSGLAGSRGALLDDLGRELERLSRALSRIARQEGAPEGAPLSAYAICAEVLRLEIERDAARKDAATWQAAAREPHEGLLKVNATLHEAHQAIAALLDGTEWSGETCEAIANILRPLGYDVRDLDDETKP